MSILNKKIINSKSGFTITEILIAIGILGLLTILIATIFLTQNQYFNEQQIRLLLESYINSAFVSMKNLIIESNAILSSYNIEGDNYLSGAETLVLKIPSIDTNKKVIFGQFDYGVIFKSGTDLKIILSPGSQSFRTAQNRIIAQEVASFNINYNGVEPYLAKTVIISMTLTKTTPNGKNVTITRSIQVTLRNQ